MSKVVICWPKNGNPEVLLIGTTSSGEHIFVASGRSEGSIARIEGEIRPTDDRSRVITGTTIDLRTRNPNRPHLQSFRRWAILFALPSAGEYELKVTGTDGAGGSDKDIKIFTAIHQIRTSKIVFAITITSHSDNQNITSEAD